MEFFGLWAFIVLLQSFRSVTSDCALDGTIVAASASKKNKIPQRAEKGRNLDAVTTHSVRLGTANRFCEVIGVN